MNSPVTITTRIRTTYFIVLFTLLASLLPVAAAHASGNGVNVIGGEEVEAGAYPWMVALIENAKDDLFWAQYCGGTLVHPQWVLTAAHCTYISGQEVVPGDIDILAGQNELRSTVGERISVEQIIRHPNYDRNTGDSDLALIKLTTPSTQPIVKMANNSMENVDESAALGTIIGWGRTETNIRVNQLHRVNVPLVTNNTCASSYIPQGYSISENMLCAGYAEGGKDACSGDSGGPLVIQENEEWVQVGVVSWGKGCAKANAYGVYTHVALFKNWIDTQIVLNNITDNTDTAVTGQLTGQSSSGTLVFLPLINN